jgi:hypothetical protein
MCWCRASAKSSAVRSASLREFLDAPQADNIVIQVPWEEDIQYLEKELGDWEKGTVSAPYETPFLWFPPELASTPLGKLAKQNNLDTILRARGALTFPVFEFGGNPVEPD